MLKRAWRQVREALRKREVVLPLWLCVAFPIWGQHGRSGFGWSVYADFAWGVLLLVVVPAAIVKLRGDKLAEYGLAVGELREGLLWTGGLLAISAPAMWLSARDPAMRAWYPLFAPGGGGGAISAGDFAVFELCYFGFFLAVEAGIRGWLLFAIRPVSVPLAVAVSALVQVVWHLGKPPGELASAVVWGIGAAVLALRLRSIGYGLLVHWLANVMLDAFIVWGGR